MPRGDPLLDHGPSGRIAEQCRQYRMVYLVATAHRAVGPENRRAGERQIADRVEYLVAHELVGKAQTFGIENPVVGENQSVLQRSPECETRTPQLRHIPHESKRAGAGDLAPECRGLDLDGECLASDQRMAEIDLHAHPKSTLVRPELPEG